MRDQFIAPFIKCASLQWLDERVLAYWQNSVVFSSSLCLIGTISWHNIVFKDKSNVDYTAYIPRNYRHDFFWPSSRLTVFDWLNSYKTAPTLIHIFDKQHKILFRGCHTYAFVVSYEPTWHPSWGYLLISKCSFKIGITVLCGMPMPTISRKLNFRSANTITFIFGIVSGVAMLI